ncbi:cytochrome c [Ostreiculturibacter nitratireducens]|uniref:c-type cytochrome n=1 Tax=Ostreiculturibacter nitratireducens TaxID=3075226 RepID=UPI0031B5F7A0
MKKAVVAATAAVLAFTGVAAAQDAGPHAQAIKARQGLMNFYAMNLGPLGAMAKGEMEYDAAAAQVAADNIAGVANLNLGMVWPQGSDNENAQGTRALPAIWADGSDIGAKASDLKAAAEAMQAAAGTDLASLQAAMQGLGAACGACHKAYRASE